ncbi:Glyoxalase 3 [Colletotrichum higginsianum]|uniref:D-lactate dehydratase n=1 Tax=Colletotrichum higginsianum TaxID=80884 RepID=A0A4T0WAX2_9PEZI|nr:Glyoxalase 3 [Colletotrichum higginsianum]
MDDIGNSYLYRERKSGSDSHPQPTSGSPETTIRHRHILNMAPPKRALIAVTSAHAPLYPKGQETGLFITEALHPFNVFREAGLDVDLVSETGTYQPDWLSQQPDWLPEKDRKVWEDHSSEFRSKLDALLKPGDIDPAKYGIFFASAGHASLIDYPDAKGLQSIASKMYADGSIVSAVCHGGAIFPGIIDPATGKSIIAGRKVTGFTTQGEEEEGVLDTIKSWNRPTIESSAASAGATYIPPPGPWDAFAYTDGRIVTGANPASAHVTAEAAVKAFQKL